VERNYIWDSNEHFHIIRFYVNGDNIFCQIFFFTGLSIGEHVSGITLAGEADKAIRGPGQEVSVPFYVAQKSVEARKVSFQKEGTPSGENCTQSRAKTTGDDVN
jgi:hypothetical protein